MAAHKGNFIKANLTTIYSKFNYSKIRFFRGRFFRHFFKAPLSIFPISDSYFHSFFRHPAYSSLFLISLEVTKKKQSLLYHLPK